MGWVGGVSGEWAVWYRQFVRGLSWARKRLEEVQKENDPDATQKAILHLDLVAADIESWWLAKPKS